MPADIKVRPFQPADLAPVVTLWNRCLVRDPITEERFWQLFLLDENFDSTGALVAHDAGGRVVGFLQAMTRRYPAGISGLQPTQGWLTVFFVAPESRRQGIGTRLLDAGEDFLRAWGRKDLACNGYAPYYIFPGVDEEYREAHEFLKARGFVPGAEAVAMGLSLEGGAVRTPDAVQARRAALETEGYAFRMFQREDTLPLLSFVEREFPHWHASVLTGLQRGNTDVVIAAHGADIVACTQWQNPYNDPPHGAAGRFGPFGVSADLRSKGIGAVVFYYLVERAVAQNSRYLWFGWAGGRNLSFYERAGCRVTRRFQLYRCRLNEVVEEQS